MPRGIPNSRVPNVAPSKVFEPMEKQIGQDATRLMKSTGPASEALEPAYIQTVDRPMEGLDHEKIAMLMFMEEPVTVHIHTTSDIKAAQVFDLGNNGQREIFKRGETKTVKRKFVDILASRKITTYTQERRQNAQGIFEDVQIPHSSLIYPFSVVKDEHPRGADWLQSVLAQP
jgi:hypothetical protein